MKRASLLLIAIFGAAGVLAADFAAGLKAYDKGDYAAALKEWQPTAEAGSAAAQFNLGLLYYNGQGVPQDYQEAIRWFTRSANQGYAKAQRNLGAVYGVGKGVKRDYIQAYKWFSLCAAAGETSCVNQRDLVARKLNASKLLAAQQMTRDWKATQEQH